VSDDAPTTTTTISADEALARAAAGALLGPLDLMAIFHLKHARFYELKKRGEFDRFLVHPPIVGRAAYSGALVHRYIRGEAVVVSTFAAKRGAR
jgi:hypothetical protein